ncbi:hypothetical protein KBC77_04005 [Candidatus Saccharibacteria bacterium]|nr:hypothetical protein [Candidatus Saccharibacteria bacterium]
MAVSKKAFIRELQKAHLTPLIIHKGWLSDLTETDVPEQISFAFLDGDFYTSIHDSLKLVVPHIQKGGVITTDDYAREALPRAAKAVHEFFAPSCIRAEHNFGILHL